jgi:hypothetical protein
MRWSTFGKRSRTHSKQRKQDPGREIHADSKSASQSSLEQSQSLGTSRHSSPYIYANQLPRTPGSETDSQHHSTPSYVVESLGVMSSLPSPHIFGPQTPSRSDAKQDESFFDFKEIPPPLPPLDHPAFRKGPPSSFKFPLAKYNFPVLPDGQDLDTDYGINDSKRQITHSLPSLKGSKGRSTQGSKERRRSMRSRPQSDAGVDSPPEKKSYIHSRQQSKSSIATSTSRRSSAEYSAKQASSIGEDLYKMHDGCWEVEVSRAMVSLALGKEEQRVETRTGSAKTARLPTQGAIPSSFGKARGKNVCTLRSPCQNITSSRPLTFFSSFCSFIFSSGRVEVNCGWAPHFFCKVCTPKAPSCSLSFRGNSHRLPATFHNDQTHAQII